MLSARPNPGASIGWMCACGQPALALCEACGGAFCPGHAWAFWTSGTECPRCGYPWTLEEEAS
jgi:hypothetical protein